MRVNAIKKKRKNRNQTPKRSKRSLRQSALGGQQENAITPFESALQLHIRGNLPAAESAYQALIANDPLDPRLHHLLGRAIHQQGRSDEGIRSIRKALEIQPDETKAINDLGLIYLELEDYQEAAKCFRAIVQLEPANVLAINHLGVALKNLDQVENAKEAFEATLELDPQNVHALCNLGNLEKLVGNLPAAELAYRRALKYDPENTEIYPYLVAVLRRQDKFSEVEIIFDQWLQHDPENSVARHLQAAASESAITPTRASPEYVRQVFDEFADTFDLHLGRLQYQGPELIQRAIHQSQLQPERALEVLDAGCGTGLCGRILKPYARQMVGVDLSSQMLHKAKQLKVYDQLIEQDLVEYLESQIDAFDLIVSADTFGYFGELETVLTAVGKGLRKAGHLICTFELLPALDPDHLDTFETETGFRLMKSGRYRHSQTFLETAIRDAGLFIRDSWPATLRMELETPQLCLVVHATSG